MNVLGIIPARGGSKSILRKNLALLAGQPLLAYTCNAAKTSSLLTRCIISTDDAEIAAMGAAMGIDAPFLRPAELATDESPMIDVVRHAMQWMDTHAGFRADAIMILQPTSPLRTATHIDDAIRLLGETGAATVVSVVQVPHQFNPTSVMTLDQEGALLPYSTATPIYRRQDKPQVFARNGPAVLVTKRDVIESGQLYGDLVRAYVMNAAESIDIDEPNDIALAEFWLSRKASSV